MASVSVVRVGTRPWTLLGCVLAAAAVVTAAPLRAAAQGGVRLIPQVGLYVPLSDLGRVQSGGDAVDVAKVESTLGLGLAVEFSPRRTWSFRINGVYGTESDVPVSGVGCPNCEARSTVAVVTGSAVFRPLPNLILVQPYLQGGAGLKRYDFDEDDARAEGLEALLSDQNELTGQLGAGIEMSAGFARLLFEVSDFISGFDLGGDDVEAEGETQHDFFVTIGIALGG